MVGTPAMIWATRGDRQSVKREIRFGKIVSWDWYENFTQLLLIFVEELVCATAGSDALNVRTRYSRKYDT